MPGFFDGSFDKDKHQFTDFRECEYRISPRWNEDVLSKYFSDNLAKITAEDFKLHDSNMQHKL